MRNTIDMAREAGFTTSKMIAHDQEIDRVWPKDHPRETCLNALEHFEALVRADEREETNRRANASWSLMCEKMVAAEREACAKVCETEWSNVAERIYGEECAAAIRARSRA